jgi:hypothetical protein
MLGLPIRRFRLSAVSLKCSIGASPAMRWTELGEIPVKRANLGWLVTGLEQDFDLVAL